MTKTQNCVSMHEFDIICFGINLSLKPRWERLPIWKTLSTAFEMTPFKSLSPQFISFTSGSKSNAWMQKRVIACNGPSYFKLPSFSFFNFFWEEKRGRKVIFNLFYTKLSLIILWPKKKKVLQMTWLWLMIWITEFINNPKKHFFPSLSSISSPFWKSRKLDFKVVQS